MSTDPAPLPPPPPPPPRPPVAPTPPADMPITSLDAPFGRQQVPSAESTGREHPDPHGFSPLVAHLDTSVLDTRRGALLVAAAAMESGEHLYGLLAGRYLGHPGVALLTDRRLLAVNARAWSPNLAAAPLASGLTAETWTVDHTLTLRFAFDRTSIVIDGISDHEGGRQFAAAVRSLAR